MDANAQLFFDVYKLSAEFRWKTLAELRAKHSLELGQRDYLLRVYQPRLKYDHSLLGNCAVTAREPGGEAHTVR